MDSLPTRDPKCPLFRGSAVRIPRASCTATSNKVVVAVKLSSTDPLVGTAGEVKDHSDEDYPDDRPPRRLKTPPLKKKSSVAMDMLVKNLVCATVGNGVLVSYAEPW